VIVVLLGPPGAGKGTQAVRLARALDLEHVSTGDLFRDHLRRRTDLGEAAESYMRAGDLVPDSIVTAMVRERVADGTRFVLDGFPRTLAQAQELESFAPVDAAVLITVPDDVLRARLTGRRVCAVGGHVYHVTEHPPREAGVCDVDGSLLIQREDDTEETVSRRLEVYREQTRPLRDYYALDSRLLEIDGTGSVETVARRMAAALGGIPALPS
jgi:adenylate kinase